MKFCPKCDSLLVPEGGKLICASCGYSEEIRDTEGYTLVSNKKRKEETGIVESEESAVTLPTTRAHCPKCGNNTAYWWMLQTRRADEPPTRFYRCTKCGKTWREYA